MVSLVDRRLVQLIRAFFTFHIAFAAESRGISLFWRVGFQAKSACITEIQWEISKNGSPRDAKIKYEYRSYRCSHSMGEPFGSLRTAFQAILGGGGHYVYFCHSGKGGLMRDLAGSGPERASRTKI